MEISKHEASLLLKTDTHCFLTVHLCNMLTTPAVWLDLYLAVLKYQDYFVLKHSFIFLHVETNNPNV